MEDDNIDRDASKTEAKRGGPNADPCPESMNLTGYVLPSSAAFHVFI